MARGLFEEAYLSLPPWDITNLGPEGCRAWLSSITRE